MIIQLLGVALISLLNITPTLQQNNIEQLIAPNIEIQDQAITIAGYENRIWFPQPTTIYKFSNNTAYERYSQVNSISAPFIFSTGEQNGVFVTVSDNNFYFHFTTNQFSLSGNSWRTIVKDYYQFSRGTSVTSETFSFTTTTTTLGANNTWYTYSVGNGTTGMMDGRIYVLNYVEVDNNTVFKKSTPYTVPTNSTFQTLVNTVVNSVNLEQSTYYDNKIAYWYTDSTPNFSVASTGNNIMIFGRTTYGNVVSTGTITYNVENDTTPPTITSISGNSVNWTNQNVTLTIQASDNVALNSNAYSFDNGATYQASNSKTFTTNEIVNVRVRDTSNNVTNQQVIINRIDKQSPAINLAGNWKNTFELGELTSNNDLYNYLSISDGASGINTSLTTISNFNYNQAGTYTNVQISATDNAGNTNNYTAPTITITEPLDTSPPTISGSTVQTREYGTVTTQGLLDSFTISDPSGIDEIRIQKLDNTIVTSWNDYNVGSHQLRVYARDTVGNIALYQFELLITAPPAPDLTPPVITGSLLLSFPMGTYTSTSEILALYTITDNVEVAIQQLIGTIDFQTQGEYQITISATDTSNNTSTRNVLVRIRSEMSLDGYNPITDLLSGIFGGVLSLIFTIGTINLLGFRLLDAMAIIILGGVIYLVYKAIRK